MRKITIFKLMLLAIILLVSGYALGQTTYTWNQTGSADFGTATNWTPTRTTLTDNDILVFNNGATTNVTGVTTQTIGGLLVSGNTIVNLNSTVASTLTIENRVIGFDLSVENGSQLNVSQTSAVALTISLDAAATGSISGSMNFSSTAKTTPNQITAADESGLTFNTGSVFTQGTNNTGNVFGNGTSLSVVFASGSTFVQSAGSNPFQKVQPASVVVFKSGSLFKVNGSNVSTSFSGRTYANFELNSSSATITASTGTSALTMDNLIITDGIFNFNMTGSPGHSIKGNITVASGATLNFNPSDVGVVNLNGSSLQTISGGGTITTSLNSTLVINNSAGVNLVNNTTLGGNLTITSGALSINPKKQLTVSGTLTNNGILNLLSDPTGTATVVTPNSIGGTTGTVSVQQYLPSARNWYISSPVSGALSLPSVNAGSLIFYSYPENDVNQVTGGGFTPGAYWNTVSTGTMVIGKGYIVKPTDAASTVTFTGTSLNTGDISINSLTYSSVNPKHGFNLIGNPYPCHLTWTEDFVEDDTNAGLIEPTIWLRTNAGSENSGVNAAWSFITYNALVGESVPDWADVVIAPMQSFWVRAKATGTLKLDSKLTRSHQSSNPLKARAAKNSNRKRLRMEVSNGISTDEALLYFDASADNGYDAFDSPKLSNASKTIPEIYMLAGSEELVINGMNAIPTTEIPLGFRTGESKNFTIKASQISNFDADTHIILKDNLLNTEKDITDGSAYNFYSDVVNSTTRFTVIFRTSSTISALDNNSADTNLITVYKNAQNRITINCSNGLSGQGVVSVYNIIGEKLASQTLTNATTVLNKTFTSGVYLVSVLSNGKVNTQKIIIN